MAPVNHPKSSLSCMHQARTQGGGGSRCSGPPASHPILTSSLGSYRYSIRKTWDLLQANQYVTFVNTCSLNYKPFRVPRVVFFTPPLPRTPTLNPSPFRPTPEYFQENLRSLSRNRMNILSISACSVKICFSSLAHRKVGEGMEITGIPETQPPHSGP